MKNAEHWRPTKFVVDGGRLVASRDAREVGVGSRLVADLIAALYDRLLPLHARGRLLDLGCGAVPLYAAYRDLVEEVVCVDWRDSEHIDHALDLSSPLPFPDARFDTLILSDVLEHVPAPELLWAEMARVLAPRGRLLLNVPFYYWLHEQPHDYYRYTEFALQRFVRRCGLQVLLLERIGGAPEIVVDIVAKHAAQVRFIGAWLADAAQAAMLRARRTRVGASISERTSHGFPLGYFMVVEKPG
jgi:SAM-dependent methyltransferase